MSVQHLFTAAVAMLAFPLASWATVVTVTHTDLNVCDSLVVPNVVDELGIGFPPDESIDAVSKLTQLVACPPTNMTTPEVLLTIFNGTGRPFADLWYVADPETRVSNIDGIVNNWFAFKIDAVGLNRPLVSESINANGIFEPGEQWDFILQDYTNSIGLPAEQLSSVGLVGFGSLGNQLSSGSIIGTPIPEPATLAMGALCLLAGAAVGVRRRFDRVAATQ